MFRQGGVAARRERSSSTDLFSMAVDRPLASNAPMMTATTFQQLPNPFPSSSQPPPSSSADACAQKESVGTAQAKHDRWRLGQNRTTYRNTYKFPSMLPTYTFPLSTTGDDTIPPMLMNL